MLVDSHCHLDFDEFSRDLDAVLARARAAGIGRFVTISVRVRDARRVLAVAERCPDVFCAIGTHPHFAHEEPDVAVADLAEFAAHPKVVAIGEAGLDTFYGSAPWDAQMRSLRTQIAAARVTGLPLVIHSVRQDEAMEAVLRDEYRAGPFGAVMHCFSGGPSLASTSLELGHYLSFSGLLGYPEHDTLRAQAAVLPAEALLVETDAPSLPPVEVEGRNEPAHLRHVVARLAALRGETAEAIERQTTANFFRAFPKVARA